MIKKEYSVDIFDKTITAEFNDLAVRSNGSVVVKCGNTSVLATAVISKYPKDGIDFFPLTVDFEEKFYAIGKILGGRFYKREGRPTDEAILSGRIVDRTIRPLFDDHIRHEVQVTILVLSLGEDDPDTLAVIAASLALGTSKIPWNGPTSAVRVGKFKNKDEYVINPTYLQRSEKDFEMDVLACGKDKTLNMIETSSSEANEEHIKQAFKKAENELEKLQIFQENIIKEIGQAKMVIEKPPYPEEIISAFDEKTNESLLSFIFNNDNEKRESGVLTGSKIQEYSEEWTNNLIQNHPETNINLAKKYFEEKVNDAVHLEAIQNNKRPDGRKIDEVRPLYAKAGGLSEVLHGSGIFYRGETHVLSVLTLGGPGDSQLIDGMEMQTQKRFMHHYNFPPFSVGETGRMGGLNRRMIGHGALAEKALLPILPETEDFPYTIRVVSECLSSNGSTSMGAVCASTLALMDGGVPIKAPVAGIAMGLMMDQNNDKKYKVLTDIQGPEDHHGDMDFKVAGTKNGVTAIQMDVKVSGIPINILCEALDKAKTARLKILEKIENEIGKPREQISKNAPKIIIVKIKPDQIGLVIGGGGKTINQIKDDTGAEIDIEDDGSVFITGKDGGAEKAAEIIREMTKEYKVGERCIGEISKIVDFGAFVKISSQTEGLLHISEIAPTRIDRVDQVLSIGEKIPVIIKEIDERDRIKLSLKDADPDYIKQKNLNNNGKNISNQRDR